ncbi:MAG: cell division ATPase MinD [Candidatus Aenigmarchaeota archaeon]|nr:cell division ATPase MinD [Candidatus Aenigmarchaeota archaeon]
MRTIGIVSGKGGVGKTTLVANLGVALSKFDRRVTLIDCNITTSHLGFCFGLFYYNKTLNHVLRKEANLSEATYFHFSGIKIIPASLSLEELIGVDIDQLKPSIENIEDTDIALLDAAPGFGREAMSVLSASSEVIFVTIPYMNAIADVVRGYRVVKQLGVRPLGIVLNMVRNDLHELTETEVEELTELPVIASIPFDKNVQKSLAEGVPTILYKDYSPASIAIMRLASELLGEYYSPPKARIFSRILDFLFPKKPNLLSSNNNLRLWK